MLVVVRESVVSNYLKVLSEARINPSIVTINSLGLANWYNLIFSNQNRDICLIDLDNYSTLISILNKGKLVFSREVNKGWEFLKADDIHLGEMVSEIQYTLSAYEKEELGPVIKEFLVTGITKGGEKLAQSLKEALGKEGGFLSPLEKINFDKTLGIDIINQVEENSLARVLGCFEADKEFEISLIQRIEKRKAAPMGISLPSLSPLLRKILVYIWFFFALGFIFGWEIYRQNVYLNQLEKHSKLISKRIRILEERKKVIELILAHLSRPASFLDVFKELSVSLPPRVFIQRFDYRYPRKELKITGIAKAPEEITRLMENLQNSILFKNVEQKYVRAGREGYTFQIDIQLK